MDGRAWRARRGIGIGGGAPRARRGERRAAAAAVDRGELVGGKRQLVDAARADLDAPAQMRAGSAVEAPAKWDSRYSHAIPHTNEYYLKCMVGGILSCGLTHAGVTPLDVTKCNMQVFPGKYKGLLSGLRTIMAEEGTGALFKGITPTLIGYSLQGLFKFGLYEFFKDYYSTLAGEENAKKYRGVIWLAGSASAEFFADIALCPMEMVKVKIQTSPPGTFPTATGAAIAKMSEMKAETRFPFGSLVPLWSRQIPYTMAKFFFFEKIVSAFYTHVFTEPKETYSKNTQLGVTFASGYLAGIVCAIVSHPADTLVSLLGKAENKGKSVGTIASEFGTMNLFTKGIGVRIIMIGTLTGLQWWIYDTYKSTFGLGTTGGK
ncbi:Mitochondrial phosphate carrier protein 3, mitochondrial [Porphyridium purpureum]|uniref:Mitochondrial phosphate carrier protein 3, mitochondrial n=1 Tax=Porphyridium purpureum TaxID=35688 RepID=A0A5J4YZQ4_PORPP|nr:Mitochondrial phosphate carrier protein 3, mitochondrial [Porphyridium purpureum]|eukprot:POR7921..scf208_2